jgi:hypothetical protein
MDRILLFVYASKAILAGMPSASSKKQEGQALHLSKYERFKFIVIV